MNVFLNKSIRCLAIFSIATFSHADNLSFARFFTDSVNQGILASHQKNHPQEIISPAKIACFKTARNEQFVKLMNDHFAKKFSAKQLQTANNFFDTHIGQTMAKQFSNSLQASKNPKFAAEQVLQIDLSKFSPAERQEYYRFSQTKIFNELNKSNSTQRIFDKSEITQEMLEIARSKFQICDIR